MSDPIVGIDLGTSNSVVAHADAAGNVTVLADDGGYKIHPSVVSFHPSGGVVVGAAAKQRKVIDPQNTVYSIKRLIGRSYRSAEVQTAKTRSPFQIKEGPNNAPVIVTRGGEFAVPEISAIVLDHVRNIAAERLASPINRAVVTVPASFNDAQRSATATAGAIAGLTVVRVLNEPTAAALAYGHTRHLREIIAVYDFGGGTFDITLLQLEDQVYEVLGTSGNTFLGGDDLDERLVDRMVGKFLAENRIDLRSNEVSMMRLRAVAEQTKIELSRRSRAVVRIDEIAYGPRGAPLNLQIEISRDEFVQEIADLVDRTFPVCSEALALAGLALDRIADVILVGGTTKIPYVRDQVSKFFGKAPRADVNPEDAVAAGAALQATSLERILSRRPSSRVKVAARPAAAPAADPPPPGPADVLELADPPESGATMAPLELPPPGTGRAKRPTADYGDPARRPGTEVTRPDTSYSVTRAGVRDQVEDAERYAAVLPVAPAALAPSAFPTPARATESFDDGTPTPFAQTQPLARLTRTSAAASPPAPSRIAGGPPAEFELELGDDGAFPGERTRPDRLATSSGAATPTPRSPARQAAPRPPQTPAPRPPLIPGTATAASVRKVSEPRPTATATATPTTGSAWAAAAEPQPWGSADSAAGTLPEPWSAKHPATAPAMAPAAPPSAPTLIAISPDRASAATARGITAYSLGGEPSVAKGFQPPQSYPVQLAAPPASAPVYPAQAAGVGPALAPLAAPPPALPAAPVLLEVTPRGLGIGTVAGYCEELIRRNARVPTEIRKLFTTSRDQQDVVRIVVCQGESRRLEQNAVIGDLVLQNLPPRPRGETAIEVTFSLDAAGVLHVRARDAQTGIEQRATLDLVGGFAPEDVPASRDRLQHLRR